MLNTKHFFVCQEKNFTKTFLAADHMTERQFKGKAKMAMAAKLFEIKNASHLICPSHW